MSPPVGLRGMGASQEATIRGCMALARELAVRSHVTVGRRWQVVSGALSPGKRRQPRALVNAAESPRPLGGTGLGYSANCPPMPPDIVVWRRNGHGLPPCGV